MTKKHVNHWKSIIPVLSALSAATLSPHVLALPQPSTTVENESPSSIEEALPLLNINEIVIDDPEAGFDNPQIPTLVDPLLQSNDPLDQVTSVTQLSDVRPTDWAFQAVQNLVERYGCLAGYPDGTFKGNRAITRYEFAAGLNACLDSITRLIVGGGDLDASDIDTLERLQQDFSSELAELGNRVDDLETRTAFLEDNQFSPTMKMLGAITFNFVDFYGGGDPQAVFQNDAFIRFSGSMSGKDNLTFSILATNNNVPDFDTPNNGVESNPLGGPGDLGTTREGTVNEAFEGSNGNNFRVNTAEYSLPIFEQGDSKFVVTAFAARGFNTGQALFARDPWLGPGRPISAFANRSPIYRLSGRAGVVGRFQVNKRFRLGAIYSANPGSSSARGGLFNGNSFFLAQTIIQPTDKLSLTLSYANKYTIPGDFKYSRISRNGAPNNPDGFIGTALANQFDNAGVFFNEDVPVNSNIYNLQAFYQLTPNINIGGFVNKVSARLIGRGDADIWTYAGMLTVTDLFKEGNLGGLVIGVEPMLTDIDATPDAGTAFANGFDDDVSLHIEAYYMHKISRRISVTPGFIWITAPNQDADNSDIFVGTVRTVFIF